MSVLFRRFARVEIFADGVLTRLHPDLRCVFYCYKSLSSTPDEMTIDIYNPGPQTREDALKTGATVRLFAGYEGNERLVTQSQIASATITRPHPDRVLKIECLEAVKDLRSVSVSLSFERGATVEQVLGAVMMATGFPIRPLQVDVSAPLRGGYSHAGRVGTVLDDMCKKIGATWTIQNGDLVILGKTEKPDAFGQLITPDTGMIGSPEPVETETKTAGGGVAKQRGWTVRSLLLPNVLPGDGVRIEAEAVKGVFRVDEIEHRGDTHGQDWYSLITAYEV